MKSYWVKSQVKRFNKRNFDSFVLGADVGGTKTDIVVSGVKGTTIKSILLSRFKTKKLRSLSEPVSMVLQYSKDKYSIEIDRACIAAASPVTNHRYCKLTNAKLEIDANEFSNETGLSTVIINDFEAIGFGINTLNPKNPADLVQIPRQVKITRPKISKETIGILGAGTGLGKSILIYNKHLKFHVPIPSEGGHADFPAGSRLEVEMVEFVKKKLGIVGPLCYEEFLSGRGLENIYSFLQQKRTSLSSKYAEEINKSKDKPALISKYSEKDEICKKTFEIFLNMYARCARNFTLEIMALGGIYIAGGIAQKNVNWFKKRFFIEEFANHRTHGHILRRIPVFLVTNQKVGLNGATFVAANLMDLRSELGLRM